MNKMNSFYRFCGFAILLSVFSCSSKFEKIRTSNNAELILKSAYQYFEEEDYMRAQTLLELSLSNFRGRRESEEIYFKYAYTFYYTSQYILASYQFRNFSETYSTSRFRQEADFMEAYSNYQLSPTYRLDQTYTQKAIDGFQLFANTYPNSERVEECNRLIEELRSKLEKKAFEEAKLYFDLRKYQSSMWVADNLLKDFPETENAEDIRFLMARSAYLLAENSVVDKQKQRYEEAQEMAAEFMTRYKNSKYFKEIRDIKESSEKQIND